MKQRRTKKQHFLPCFVQHGFAFYVEFGGTRHKYRVYLFRRGRESKEPYTRDVGFENDFYCRPGEPDVEVKLADEERKRFARLVRELRRGAVPRDRICDIPAFVAHLIVRTRNARRRLAMVGDDACDVIADELPRADPWARALEHMPAEARVRLDAKPAAEREQLLAGLLEIATQWLQVQMAVQKERIPEQVRRQQASTLSTGFDALPRTAHLASLSWSVVMASPGALILGDVGPIARDQGDTELAAPLTMQRPDVIYVPVAHDCVLVGAREGVNSMFDPEQLNTASAELSVEFFIAFQSTPREYAYAERIGDRASLVPRQELVDALRRT